MTYRKATILPIPEVQEIIQERLDNSQLKIKFTSNLYQAFSDTQDLDAGEIDDIVKEYLIERGFIPSHIVFFEGFPIEVNSSIVFLYL